MSNDYETHCFCWTGTAWYPRINYQLALSLVWLIVALLQITLAFTRNIYSLIFTIVVLGVAVGTVEAGSNVYISTLWGREGLPFRQALMLCRGAGSAIAPLIIRPFLMRQESQNETNAEYYPDRVRLVWPFSIFGTLYLVAACLTFCVWRMHPDTPDHPSRVTEIPDTMRRPSMESNCHDKAWPKTNFHFWKKIMIALCIIFLFTDCAIDVTVRSFIATYAKSSSMSLPQATGADLTTCFFAAATAFRFMGIFYILWIGIEVNFLLSMLLLTAANAILLPFADSNEPLLWMGVAMIGTSTANNIPCIYSYMEEFFPITSQIVSITSVTSSLSYILFPLLFSYYIQSFPISLFWCSALCTACMGITLPAIVMVARKRLR